MVDDGVIDIRKYLNDPGLGKRPRAFSVWGGGGDRSRFALPVWRAIYLARGDWGAIVRYDPSDGDSSPRPFFVLDLEEDPARMVSPTRSLRELVRERVPAVSLTIQGGLAVLLGQEGPTMWCLQVLGMDGKRGLEDRAREALLFLAGECAGLLFIRELATLSPSSSSAP